jgi:hypothetical protein
MIGEVNDVAMVPSPLEPLYWFNIAVILLVGLVTWLLKRLIRTLDALRARIHNLEIEMAYLTRKDRLRRLEDYSDQDRG